MGTMWSPSFGQLVSATAGDALTGCVGECTSEAEVCGWEGVGLAETQGEIVGGPWAEARRGGDRGDELIQSSASIEIDLAIGDGSSEGVDGASARRREAETAEVGGGQVRWRGEEVGQAERPQSGGRGAVTFDDTGDDRVGGPDADLLADDGSNAGLEGVPGAWRTETWVEAQQRPDDGVAAEAVSGSFHVGVEVEDAPGSLHDVDETFPMRQVRPEKEVVGRAP